MGTQSSKKARQKQIKTLERNKIKQQQFKQQVVQIDYYSTINNKNIHYHDQKASVCVSIAIVGQNYTGKSSIISSFRHMLNHYGGFSNLSWTDQILHYDSEGNLTKKCKIDVKLIEIANGMQKQYPTNAEKQLKMVDGVIFVFDLSLPFSLLIDRWIPFALKHCPKETNMVLFGNKLDKKRDSCVLEAKQKAQKYGFQYYGVSALTKQNLREAMGQFIRKIATRKIGIPLKDIYMNLLLTINEDFDDDLLFDIMGLLTQQQK